MMTKWIKAKQSDAMTRTSWRIFMLVCFLFAAIGLAILSLMKGSMTIAAGDVLQAVFGNHSNVSGQVIWNIRLPRTIVAGLVGMNLAMAGAILQSVMRNPLADPHIIGISSGAGLAGVIILILFPQMEYLVTPAAFLGAMAAAIMVYLLAWKGGIKPIRIILAGVAVSAFLGAGISALMVFYSDRVHGALMWMVGGFSARSWPHFYIIMPYSVVGGLLALGYAKKLNVLNLGDDVARSLGLNVECTRLTSTAIAALLAASAVSVAGLLGFVGLIVPHVARLLVGSDYRFLLPASALLGLGTVIGCDTIARTVFAPVEIPVGIIMAMVGAPFFLYLLRREA